MVKIGIIGGTGFYDHGLMKSAELKKVNTPFGHTSGMITVGEYEGTDLVILPRHDIYHRIMPSDINYRANIWAMKELGVTHILAPSAVGSLQSNIRPGDIVIPDQFIDRTTKRKSTFYEGDSVCHISTADPFCHRLRDIITKSAKELKLKVHPKGTVVVIEGPRFSTRAESNLFRSWKADIVNMTIVPECVLAREAQMCYASIAMVTDYDCWKRHAVDAAEVIKTMKMNVNNVKELIKRVIPRIVDADCSCRHALEGAFI
ncbi:MAG: S-methyl-5'-thioadenosine phosphorylase [Candidatus Micrarchaeia archaeon]